jgi:hypothetical protein
VGAVKHLKQTTVPDDLADDPQRVSPDDWNDDHDVTLTAADVSAAPSSHITETSHIRISEPTPTLHVSPTGDNAFDGRWDRPKLTPQAAIDALPGNAGHIFLVGSLAVPATGLLVPRGISLEGSGGTSTILTQSTSGAPIIKASGADCHSVGIRNLQLKYATNQTDPASIGIQFTSGQTHYWWDVQGVRITGAYNGIGLQSGTAVFFASNIGTESPVIIDESYNRAISLDPTTGSPGLVFGNIYITNSVVTPIGIAVFANAQQATFEYLSVSGWLNQVLQVGGGNHRVQIEALHIESCTFDAATGIGWIDILGGHTHITNATFTGTWNTGINEPIIRVPNSGAHLIIEQLQTAITVTSGTPMLFNMGVGSKIIIREWNDVSGTVSHFSTAAASQGIKNYLGSQARRIFALTDGATVASDPLNGDYFTLSAGGSRTIAAPSHSYSGAVITYEILNNTAGTITTTWNAAFTVVSWTDPVAGARATITFAYNGTNWMQIDAVNEGAPVHPDLATHDALGLATQTELDAHTGDTGDAHDASAISILDTAADFTATDVEGALAELQADNEAHAGAADPHTGYRLESASIQTDDIADDAITYGKMQHTAAAAKLLGKGAGAVGGQLEEITLGTNLSMTGATINASGGSGDVATDPIWDAPGDLTAGTGANTAVRVPVGANEASLIAKSTASAGIGWLAAAVANIMAPSYGAVRDNSTDNTLMIQAALDSGLEVLIPGGPTGTAFRTGALTASRIGQVIRGDGSGPSPGDRLGPSILRAKTSFTGDVLSIAAYGITVEDFTIDGNANGAASGILYSDGAGARINRMKAYKCKVGYHVNHAATKNSIGVVMRDCVAEWCSLFGFAHMKGVVSGSSGNNQYIVYDHCDAFNCGDNPTGSLDHGGFLIKQQGNILMNCKAEGCFGYGMQMGESIDNAGAAYETHIFRPWMEANTIGGLRLQRQAFTRLESGSNIQDITMRVGDDGPIQTIAEGSQEYRINPGMTTGDYICFVGFGGIPIIRPGGATANVDLIVRGKGTGRTRIGMAATDRLVGRDTAGAGDSEELTVGGGVEFTGSGGIQRSALTGDVTASAGSGSTTIANDAVTYAKQQDVSAASKLLGRGSAAGAGNPEEITVGSGLTMSGTTLSSSGGPWTPVMKTVDESVTNNTLQDDDTLLFTTVANTQYVIRLCVFFITGATADFKYRLAHTGTTTRVRRMITRYAGGATSATWPTIAHATAFDAADVALAGTGTDGGIIEYIVLQVGASGGQVKFQWAQNTTDATAATVLEGSHLEYATV